MRIVAETNVYLMDTIGELGLLYRSAPFAFIGGSLVAHGGQNPLEPARLGVAPLHGPHVFNFRAEYAEMDAAGGAVLVADEAALAARAGAWLDDPEAARAAGAEARRIAVSRSRMAMATGVLPAPPSVRLPTQMTGTAGRICGGRFSRVRTTKP